MTKKTWLAVGLVAAIVLTTALADICLPVRHAVRAAHHHRLTHYVVRHRHAMARVVGKNCPPIFLPPVLTPPSLDPFSVDDQEHDLVMEIETTPPPMQVSPPLELDTDYYGWMIPPDIGVPNRDRGKCHRWSRCHHETAPEPSTIFLMLGGLGMLGSALRRRAM